MNLLFRRVVAYLVDVSIGFLLAMIPQLIIANLTGFQASIQSGYLMELWVLLTISSVVWAYFIIGEMSAAQATIGKRVMRIQLISDDDDKPTIRQVISRTALKLLPWEMTHIAVLIPDILFYQDEVIATPRLIITYAIVYGLLIIYGIIAFRTRGQKTAYDYLSKTSIAAR